MTTPTPQSEPSRIPPTPLSEQSTPSPEPAGPPPANGSPCVPGYELTDEVGRGGMGVVWRARDLRLDREVAVKLLRDDAPADSPLAARFRAEAELTGQLQHPGIPPVHELGTLPDGRPFLAMKLVKGQTLRELLAERPTLASPDRGRFIAIFEQICQAVGYAHAHRVIHRDLKPSNVMVGAFGEVQVMDWGLAKVLPPNRVREQTDKADTLLAGVSGVVGGPPLARLEDLFVTGPYIPASDTPEQDEAATQTGTVLGTLAYMPPEQAAGEIRKLDARSDVFGLGAILCEILTGRPPYTGRDGNAVRVQAVHGELHEAFARLDRCGAEPEVVALCKRCLAFKQEDRPADGKAVAQAVAALRQAAEERARQAELAQARAEVRAVEQARRRRVVQWAGGIIAATLLVGMVGTSLGLIEARRQAALAQANEAEARRQEELAKAETTAKEQALQAETVARQKAMTALRTLTDEFVEHQLARGTTLTEENKAFLRKIIEQFEGFAAITGDDAESRMIRAEGHSRVGRMRHRLGELKEAEAAYRDALALQQQLVDQFPSRPDYRQELAGSHNNLGLLLHATGRLKEAEAAYRDALALKQQLVDQFPDQPDRRNELAGTLGNLALLRLQQKEFAQARQLLNEARPHHQAALTANPTNPDYRKFFRNNREIMCYVLLGLGEHAAAVQEAHELARFGYDPPTDTYIAACFIARCIKLAEQDQQLAEAERRKLADDYADQAMTLLRQAVERGWKNAAHMEKDDDLAPLRGREDFQKLLAELTAKGTPPRKP